MPMARPQPRSAPIARRTAGLAVLALVLISVAIPGSAAARTFSAPTYSSPITLSADGRFLWVVDPGGDRVVVISTRSDRVIRRIRVGDEPQGVAVDPNNRYAYVANAADGRVTVIRI